MARTKSTFNQLIECKRVSYSIEYPFLTGDSNYLHGFHSPATDDNVYVRNNGTIK